MTKVEPFGQVYVFTKLFPRGFLLLLEFYYNKIIHKMNISMFIEKVPLFWNFFGTILIKGCYCNVFRFHLKVEPLGFSFKSIQKISLSRHYHSQFLIKRNMRYYNIFQSYYGGTVYIVKFSNKCMKTKIK